MLTTQDSTNVVIRRAQLDLLPDEVLTAIFSYLDATSLSKVLSLSRKLNSVGNEGSLWRILTLQDFKYWEDSDHIKEERHLAAQQTWKGLYASRRVSATWTANLVKGLVDIPHGRLRKAESIQNGGYRTKDALLRLYHEAPTECLLAQRYWVHAMLGCVNRAYALRRLNAVRIGRNALNGTEEALAALDMFILGPDANGDMNDTFRRLGEMVAALRNAHPEIDTKTTREKACIIAEFLRAKKWVGIQGDSDHYTIEDQFLGIALRSSHHNSLPLVTCVIFCYVCRAFGLRAQPCSYPNHIHAVIQPPRPSNPDEAVDLDGQLLPASFRIARERGDNFADLIDGGSEPPTESTHLYMDPFNSAEPVALSLLQERLNFFRSGMNRATRASFLLPAPTQPLLIRTAMNLLNSIRENTFRQRNIYGRAPASGTRNFYDEDGNELRIDMHAAAYAALYVRVLFAPRPDIMHDELQTLQEYFAHHFPEDIPNYVTYLRPHISASLGVETNEREDDLVQALRAQDETLPMPKLRRDYELLGNGAGVSEPIVHKVGTVFKHRRQNYHAVIYGWDGSCNMEERWIVGNGVDSLPKGRGQPFYNA